jgi:hypothetical protein
VKREPVPSFGVEPLDGTAEEGFDESMDSKPIAKETMEFLRTLFTAGGVRLAHR